MFRTFRAALAVATLLCCSEFAHAGPLQWGYRAEAPDGTVLSEVHGLTDLFWSDFFFPDLQQYGTKLPDPNPDGPLRTDIWRGQAAVTVIDELTGQSNSLTIYADLIRQYEIKSDGSLYPVYEGTDGSPWPGAAIFTLGGNSYSLRAPGGELTIDVILDSTAATPEPGTLALAGLGLSALGLARRLRRG